MDTFTAFRNPPHEEQWQYGELGIGSFPRLEGCGSEEVSVRNACSLHSDWRGVLQPPRNPARLSLRKPEMLMGVMVLQRVGEDRHRGRKKVELLCIVIPVRCLQEGSWAPAVLQFSSSSHEGQRHHLEPQLVFQNQATIL